MFKDKLTRQVKARRTFAIISHPDAGKTTMTEKLLLWGKAIQVAGMVKSRKSDRAATSDWMEMEKERGISITTSVMQFPFKGYTINLLDTPGHEDFSEDTYRTLTAVDAALMVIDGAKGVEDRTIKLMDVCRMRDTPIISFVNKMDREIREPLELLDEIENVLKIRCVPITWPLGTGRDFAGVYNLLEEKLYVYKAGFGSTITDIEIREGYDYPDIREKVGDFESRPFADSAPIFEKSLAENAGMGWTGKHTLLIHPQAGSFFVLGELFTSLPLAEDKKQIETTLSHCGSCRACIHVCPTHAIRKTPTGHYDVDARLCISYLTIELDGKIPVELRPKIGNRIFGCDDCQLICPWNKFARLATIEDFNPRHRLDKLSLLELWAWDTQDFLTKTEGSPIRRTGYDNFMRNVAVALGNAPFNQVIIDKLQQKRPMLSENTQEHIDWAIQQQLSKS